MKKARRKILDFEVNLMPVISVLAVCISLLLLTTVWVHIGAFNVTQALGSESKQEEESKPQPTLWLELENSGSIQIFVKTGSKTNARWKLRGMSKNRLNVDRIHGFTKKVRRSYPNIKTALILPAPQSSYKDMIAIMDDLRKEKFSDIGIAPL